MFAAAYWQEVPLCLAFLQLDPGFPACISTELCVENSNQNELCYG
jgi:hypothetical protein